MILNDFSTYDLEKIKYYFAEYLAQCNDTDHDEWNGTERIVHEAVIKDFLLWYMKKCGATEILEDQLRRAQDALIEKRAKYLELPDTNPIEEEEEDGPF